MNATSISRRPRWGFARVEGASMSPALLAGDVLWVRYRVADLQPGQAVVARFADGTIAVKRVAEVRGEGQSDQDCSPQAYWLLSDNRAVGVDSRHRGAVPQRDVVATVVCRVWPPRKDHGLTMGLFRSV